MGSKRRNASRIDKNRGRLEGAHGDETRPPVETLSTAVLRGRTRRAYRSRASANAALRGAGPRTSNGDATSY
jgi:hypothetical protein